MVLGAGWYFDEWRAGMVLYVFEGKQGMGLGQELVGGQMWYGNAAENFLLHGLMFVKVELGTEEQSGLELVIHKLMLKLLCF